MVWNMFLQEPKVGLTSLSERHVADPLRVLREIATQAKFRKFRHPAALSKEFEGHWSSSTLSINHQ